MRPLSAALQAAIGSGTPLTMLELIDWAPHYAAVVSSGGVAGRHGAVIAVDGTLVQAYNDGGGHVYARRVSDPTQSAWGAWTLVGSNGRASGEICLAALSDRLRIFWQDNATTNLYFSDSFTNGSSWSAGAILFDPGAACAGMGADASSTQVFVLYQVGAAWRVALWTFSGAWTKADWTNGDWYGVAGLGVVRVSVTSFLVALALQQAAGTGLTVQLAAWVGGAWGNLQTVVPADLSAGVAVQDPHLVIYDNLYHLCYGVSDSGAVSGLLYGRAALLHSVDSVHWTDPLEDGASYAHGAVALKHAAGYLLAAPDAAALAPLYTGGATQYKDCTVDVSRLEVIQKDGEPAHLIVTLQNDMGQYNALAPLRPNARLRLSLGYAGAGTAPAYIFYIDDWSFTGAAGESELVITASDALAWLDRQSRATLVYSGQTVDWLAREIAARAGLLTVSTPVTAQCAQSVATFAVPAGTTWRAALLRLSRLYGFDAAARTGSDGRDSLAIIEKSPADAPVWSYGAEVESRVVARNGDRANHIHVAGAPAVGGPPIGEAWDWADVTATGQERYLHVVEPQISTPTGAGIRATLDLNREMRRAASGSLSVALHPGLEAWDVVAVSGGSGPSATLRVATLHHIHDPGAGLYDTVLTLEGQ